MKITPQKYFDRLLNSNELEKLEDKLQNDLSMEVSSIWESVEKGRCWYPVRINRVETWHDAFYILKIKYERENEKRHSFFLGHRVLISNSRVFTNSSYKIEGTITAVGKRHMSIRVSPKDYKSHESRQSWLNYDDLKVEIIYNRKGYERASGYLKKLRNTPGPQRSKVLNVLIGNTPADLGPPVDVTSPKIQNILENLNTPQRQAVNTILRTNDVAMVLGPPGTGKTTTIAGAVKACLIASNYKAKILVTAPSNTAVDVLATRIAALGDVKVVRIGNSEKINTEAAKLTADGRVHEHPDFPLLNGISQLIQRRFDDIRRMEYSSSERRVMLIQNLADKKMRNRLHKAIEKDICKDAHVVACTMESAISQGVTKIHKKQFDYVFIDEAGQAIEPMNWLPIFKGDRVVLIGDHNQLPPVVKSSETHEMDLGTSLFERVMNNGNLDHNLLSVQYRMNQQIMGFSNAYFYQGELKAGNGNRHHRISKESKKQWNNPLEFLDTRDCRFEESTTKAISSKSTINPKEIKLLIAHLEKLTVEIEQCKTLEIPIEQISVGVITPYRDQFYLLEDAIEESSSIERFPGLIQARTIDGFQGQECDIIYISLVRSNPKGAIGFLKEYRRMNVALTRARRKLVIIGDGATLEKDAFYKDLIQYTKNEKSYSSAKEWLSLAGLKIIAEDSSVEPVHA